VEGWGGCGTGPVRRTERAACVLVAVTLLAVTSASPASAHGRTGSYRTAVTSIRPGVPGLAVSVTPDGRWVRVTNTRSTTVVILGYEGELYLRVNASGSWENSSSPTSRLAAPSARRGLASTMAAAGPHWVRRSSRSTVSFHDLRVPQATTGTVRAPMSPMPRVLKSWSLPLLAGNRQVTVSGTLTWRPTPVPKAWLAILTLSSLCFFAFVRVVVRQERRSSSARSRIGANA
jgi:hypothetical protein